MESHTHTPHYSLQVSDHLGNTIQVATGQISRSDLACDDRHMHITQALLSLFMYCMHDTKDHKYMSRIKTRDNMSNDLLHQLALSDCRNATEASLMRACMCAHIASASTARRTGTRTCTRAFASTLK